MAINGASPYSNKFRIGGLATGMDTDQMVSDLMRVERMPVDKLMQKRQISEWKRDDYRSTTNLLRALKDDFFNSLKPASNMMSQSIYKKFSATSTNSSIVTATANADAVTGTHKIKVDNLATAAVAESSSTVTKLVEGSLAADFVAASGKNFELTVDGTKKMMTIDSSITSIATLQSAIDSSFGVNKVMVQDAGGGKLQFTPKPGSGVSKISLGAGSNDALSNLGFSNTDNKSNRLNTLDTIANITSKMNTAIKFKAKSNIGTQSMAAIGSMDFSGVNNKSFAVNIDGVSKNITLDANYSSDTDYANLLADMKTKIESAFAGKTVSVTENAGKLSIALSAGGSSLSIGESATGTSALTNLGYVADMMDVTINSKNFTFNKSTTLSSMLNQINSDSTAGVNIQYDEVLDTFKITSKEMGAGNNIKISENSSTFFSAMNFKAVTGSGTANAALHDYAGVEKSFGVVIDGVSKDITLDGNYSAFGTDSSGVATDLTNAIKTKIESAFSLSAGSVSVTESGGKLSINLVGDKSTMVIGAPTTGTSALSDLGITSSYSAGEDASVQVDGQTLTRSSNNFSVSGVTYNLLAEGVEQTISLSQDVDGVYNNIKTFVDKYNEVITTINKKFEEDYDRDYLPLTSEQKEAMSEDDIKKWDEKAKSGLLKGDRLLSNISQAMRKALIDNVEGVTSSLSSMGITTGNYQNKGKLVIDETKLKAAIKNDPDAITNLFTKTSSSYPTYGSWNKITSTSTSSSALQDYTSSSKGLKITIDGTSKDITLDGNYTTYEELTAAIESKLEGAFSGKGFAVSQAAGYLNISLATGGTNLSIGEPTTGASALNDMGFVATSGTPRTTRYSQEGLAHRLFDVVEDNIRTYRDSTSKKGFLLEKAGLVGDTSEFLNSMSTEISGFEVKIDSFGDRLLAKENNYYKKFAAMERMISQMNSQSSWLTSQLGGGG